MIKYLTFQLRLDELMEALQRIRILSSSSSVVKMLCNLTILIKLYILSCSFCLNCLCLYCPVVQIVLFVLNCLVIQIVLFFYSLAIFFSPKCLVVCVELFVSPYWLFFYCLVVNVELFVPILLKYVPFSCCLCRYCLVEIVPICDNTYLHRHWPTDAGLRPLGNVHGCPGSYFAVIPTPTQLVEEKKCQ